MATTSTEEAMNSTPATVMRAARADATPDRRRWLILGTVALAQLMVVLDATIVNIALPSAQRDLGFSTADRQWVVTAYALTFGSLLLFGGRLGDLIGRKITFLTGAAGFAAASAVGGAATSFGMLVAARAAQGAFGALLAPAALSILSTTFSDPKERGKAFGVYGAIVGAGGALGLVLGGILTQYLSWRWCLYVNLIFASLAVTGAVTLLRRQASRGRSRLDLPGVALVSAAMFCLVYGFSNAATHGWHTPSTYGFLAAGVALLAAFALWQFRAASPLLPPRIVADRNRGAAYLAVLIAGAGIFGIFLFLIYYLQQTLHYSPVVSGVAFLPMIAMVVLAANVSNVVLMPRVGPKPLVTAGMLLAAGSLVWLTQIGVHSCYATAVLGPLLVAGLGFGFTIAPSMNTGTFGVSSQDAGVASATLNTGQQIGGSIGTSLLNTIFATAVAGYLTGHLSPAAAVHGHPAPSLVAMALIHGYTTGFWVAAAIFATGAVICGALFRFGPLRAPAPPAAASASAAAQQSFLNRWDSPLARPSGSQPGRQPAQAAGPSATATPVRPGPHRGCAR
jgi:EmrB/QacA subfamily drug resistance transporter